MRIKKSVCVLVLGLAFAGCTSTTDPTSTADASTPLNGTRTLLSLKDEPPSHDCATGGKRIQFGADRDGDGVLDQNEIEGSTVLCNGLVGSIGPRGDAGANGLKGDRGDAGATGPQGETGATGPKGDRGDAGATGPQGETGATGPKGDRGDAGPTGTQGETGPRGPRGDAGPRGSDGYNSLVTLTAEPPGDNCPNGGTLIQVGLDNGDGAGTAGDGTLDPDEVDNSAYVCSGQACTAPTYDVNLGTGNLTWDSHVPYSGDDVTLACNTQGTTLDLVYRWTASTNGCVHFNPRVSGQGTHPFFAILDVCSGQALSCTQGGTDFEVEQGKTYLLAAEPYTAGNTLGGIEVSPFCD